MGASRGWGNDGRGIGWVLLGVWVLCGIGEDDICGFSLGGKFGLPLLKG